MKATGGASRPRLDHEFVAAFKRRALTRALADLCAENGYRTTTVGQIVARAQTSRGTFYRHFPDKVAVFEALLEAASDDLFACMESACAEAADLADARLSVGLAALLAWIENNRNAAHSLFAEAFSASPDSLRFYFAQLSRGGKLLAGVVPEEVVRPIDTIESLVGGIAMILRDRLLQRRTEGIRLLLPDLEALVRQPFLSSTSLEGGAVLDDVRP